MTEQIFSLSPLPPLPLIRELGESLESGARRRILDVGTGIGRNAQYLAGLGHAVVGLDVDMAQLRALQSAPMLENGPTTNLRMVAGNAQNLPFGPVFDIACMNELNLQMSRTATNAALAELRRVTVQGGLNVVSGYLLFPDEGTERNKARAFQPGELSTIYRDCGWHVLRRREVRHPLQYSAGKQVVSSLSMIIVQRPWGLRPTSM